MTNKINSIKSRTKRADRNTDENPRAESNNLRSLKNNNNRDEEPTKGTIENVNRRGYYSRNGGYGGYRGL